MPRSRARSVWCWGAVGGHDDHGEVGFDGVEDPGELEPVESWQDEVRHQHVERMTTSCFRRRFQRRLGRRDDVDR